MLALLERHEFLGPTLYGGYEGIDYSAGKLDERWISQPCGGEEANVFEWDFENGQEDWTLKRYPTTFSPSLTVALIFSLDFTRKSNQRDLNCATIQRLLKTPLPVLQI
jgi:hypothetical protein